MSLSNFIFSEQLNLIILLHLYANLKIIIIKNNLISVKTFSISIFKQNLTKLKNR